MPTYESLLNNPSSRREIFSTLTVRSHQFGFVAGGGAWYTTIQEVTVDSAKENGTSMVSETSLANLVASTTTTVGHFFWDWDNERFYVKPKASTTVYENYYIATCKIRLSYDGTALVESTVLTPYDSKMLNIPSLNMRGQEVFDGAVIPISSGSVELVNTDFLFNRTDLALDGEIEIKARLKTIAGV